MSRARWLRSLVLAVAAAALPAVTAAHPLGNFSINHWVGVTVSPEAVAVDLVIDLAEVPAIDALAAMDRDADGEVTAEELAAAAGPACADRAAAVGVVVDGTRVALRVAAAAIEPAAGAGGLRTVRTTCGLAGPIGAPLASATTVTVTDLGDPDRLGWREIVVRGTGVAVDPEAATDVSHRLTAYPDDLLQRPLDERSITVTVTPGGPGAVRPAPAAGGPRSTAEATPAIDFGSLTPAAAILGILLGAVTGAGHAVTPGHGKTLMAAYLVGTRGRPRDAVLLGLAVTASHTLGVVALAGVVLLAGSALPADRLYPVLSGISGILVIGIGAWLLIGCLTHRRAHDHGEAHHQDHPHPHAHPHPHPQVPNVGRGGLLVIGLAGGMIPSPAALVLLLGAIAAGQPAYGLVLAVAFGCGMAAVLVALGLLVVRGRARVMALAGRLPGLARLAPAVPWAAAAVVLVGGLALTGGAVVAAI